MSIWVRLNSAWVSIYLTFQFQKCLRRLLDVFGINVLIGFICCIDCFLNEVSLLSLWISACYCYEWSSEAVCLVIVMNHSYFLYAAYFSATGVESQLTLPGWVNFTLTLKLLLLNQILSLLPLAHQSLVHQRHIFRVVVRTPEIHICIQLLFRYRVRIEVTLWPQFTSNLCLAFQGWWFYLGWMPLRALIERVVIVSIYFVSLKEWLNFDFRVLHLGKLVHLVAKGVLRHLFQPYSCNWRLLAGGHRVHTGGPLSQFLLMGWEHRLEWLVSISFRNWVFLRYCSYRLPSARNDSWLRSVQ